jgi:hypothetical protein
MPPLGRFEADRGFIPDLSVLLMFDEFIIDGEAYERIRSDAPPAWLGPWPEILEILDAEGALSTVDVDQEMKKVAAIRGGMLRRDLHNPAKWISAMRYHDNLMLAAENAFKDKVEESTDLTWEFDKDRGPFFSWSDHKLHTRSGALVIPEGDDSNSFHNQMSEEAIGFLRLQLGEVNAALAISKLLEAAPMLWAPYGEYLQTKALESIPVKEVNKQLEASRLFFRVAFHRYRPDNVRDLERLRRDKRVRQLRDVIVTASETGEVMDPQYPQRVLEGVLKIEKRIGRIRQISGWISSAIGCIPIPLLGLGATAAAEVISRQVETSLRRKWNWFYLISDGTGHS